jgi:peptidoglycan/xylan/chitin deacetylase (PgdA/CDA1 family)
VTSLVQQGKSLAKRGLEHFAAHFGPHTRHGEPRLWVLMYHRILPVDDERFAQEEPGMIVTPETFRQQLRELKQLFTVLPLTEWIERRNAGNPLPKRACAITFDDGWLDNYQYALPILQQEQVPATLFAVSHMIGTQREFWPNRLARLLSLAPSEISYAELGWLHDAPHFSKNGTHDREAIAAIINYCKKFSDADLHGWLDQAEHALHIENTPTPSLMNWDQLRSMHQSELVTIGSHTRNHYRLLNTLAQETLIGEIRESKTLLERELETTVDLFCYPNGDVCDAAIAEVQNTYSAAVTTQRGINTATTLPHQLLRIGVHEDVSHSSVQFKARLSGWM